MAVASTPTREVVCPGCGRRRTLSDRNARRNPQSCNLCRAPQKYKLPDDTDRRYWLKRFTDKEILDLAFGIFEQEGSMTTIRSWRERLLPGGGV